MIKSDIDNIGFRLYNISRKEGIDHNDKKRDCGKCPSRY